MMHLGMKNGSVVFVLMAEMQKLVLEQTKLYLEALENMKTVMINDSLGIFKSTIFLPVVDGLIKLVDDDDVAIGC